MRQFWNSLVLCQDLTSWCFPIRSWEDFSGSPVQGLVFQVFPFGRQHSCTWSQTLCGPGSVKVPWLIYWVSSWSKVGQSGGGGGREEGVEDVSYPTEGHSPTDKISLLHGHATLPPSLLLSVGVGGKGTSTGQHSPFIAWVQSDVWLEAPSWTLVGLSMISSTYH